MHRFFVSKEAIGDGEVVIAGEQVHQIRNVLRMGEGDCIVVLDNSGFEFEVRLDKVSCGEVRGAITGKREVTTEPGVKIVLYQSLMKRAKFEFVLQKCTEVGVAGFVPVVTSRTVIGDTAKITDKKMRRWRRIIKESAEQSERGVLPRMEEAVELDEAIKESEGLVKRLFCGSRGAGVDLRNVSRDLSGESSQRIGLFVGPEGGFSGEEADKLQDSGVLGLSLGPRILRTETAAVVGSALILYENGQMQRES